MICAPLGLDSGSWKSFTSWVTSAGEACLDLIHKQDVAVRYRVKDGARQPKPDHRAEGFLTRIDLDVTCGPAVAQRDERLNLGWLLLLALSFFLDSLEDPLGLRIRSAICGSSSRTVRR